MTEIERFQALIALASKWLDDSVTKGSFIPDNDVMDKIARNRTGNCARQLLRILAGEKT